MKHKTHLLDTELGVYCSNCKKVQPVDNSKPNTLNGEQLYTRFTCPVCHQELHVGDKLEDIEIQKRYHNKQ